MKTFFPPVSVSISDILALGLSLMLFIETSVAQTLAINEIMSFNASTIADEDGDYEDWIELYNYGNEPVELYGYGLSDDYSKVFKWIFPDVAIPPGEFLIVWASGKNRTHTHSPLHTNFSIKADGEEILLTHPSGVVIDEVEPIFIPIDISYGRTPDGTGLRFFFDEPTPGAGNPSTGYFGVQSAPEFSHQGATFTEPFLLTLESDSAATILYVMNNNNPLPDSGMIYTSSVTINETAYIRAIAIRDGYLSSEPRTMIYSHIAEDVRNFKSNLPLIILHQFDEPITPDDRSVASAIFIDHNYGDSTFLTGDIALQSRILANIRGTTSQSFPKKMFGFHLIDELDNSHNESLFGLPAEHNWILYAPYCDKTLMRNAIAYTLGSGFGRWAPRTRFVELFLHDGYGSVRTENYHGVYLLVERIKWGDDRINITKINLNDNAEPEISGGYIIKKDRLNEGELGITTDRGTLLAFVRPSEDNITVQQTVWIRNFINDFETTLFNPEFEDPINGYEQYIDTDSFIDHFLITELLKEVDGYRLSTFMYKDRNEKLVMGPVWDYNLSIGNANFLEGYLPEGWYYPLVINEACANWYERLLEDPTFQQRLLNRWWNLRQHLFSNNHLSSLIYEYKYLLSEAQVRNFIRWPILGYQTWPNWFVGQTYQEEVDWMHDWLIERLTWLDSQLSGAPSLPDHDLIYFWFFSVGLPNNTPLEQIGASYQILETGNLHYHSALEGYPFNPDHPYWRKASMERRNAPTGLNYRPKGNNYIPFIDANLRGLQVKQPFIGDAGVNKIVFNLPSTGYEELIFSFAAKDEGAAEYILIDYSIAPAEAEWTTTGLITDSLFLEDEYQLFETDFSEIEATYNNPDFKIRLRFGGSDMNADNGDRVTFNNFSLDGKPSPGINLSPVVENPVDFQKLIEAGPFLTINLNEVFSDPDNDPLAFTAHADNPHMVEISFEGSNLTIKPMQRGGTCIVLSADDGFNPPVMSSFRVLIYPEAFRFGNGAFSFTEWDADVPEYSYPENMLFLQSDVSDPTLEYPLLYPYYIPHDDYHADDQGTIGFPYNNTGRTRINGLGEDGISFINTGRGRDLGGALLAIDTRGVTSAKLSWVAGTIIENSRAYALRLQYRAGITDPFSDLLVNGESLEYLTATGGDIMEFESFALPPETFEREYVQLLWRYYHVSGISGPRAQLRLDDIVFSEITGVHKPENQLQNISAQNGTLSIEFSEVTDCIISLFDITGRMVHNQPLKGSGKYILNIGKKHGIYIAIITTDTLVFTQKVFIY